MNHMTSKIESASHPHPPASRRQTAKLRTRDRVIDAAKRMFMDRGYEAATIRDIASAADLSTGAVFASFTDKADLFRQVMDNDQAALLALIADADKHPGPVAEALGELFSAGYAFQLDQLPLLQAAASLSWSPGLQGELGDRPQRGPVLSLIKEILNKALERGELDGRLSVNLTAEMMWEAYVSNYRHAVFEGWRLEQLRAHIDRQIEVILAGARAA